MSEVTPIRPSARPKSAAAPLGLHRLPAPHDRIEFRIGGYLYDDMKSLRCSVQYSGSAEDLISAGVVTRQMVTDKTGRIYARGHHTRRDAAGGKIHVRYLKHEVVVDFFHALEHGLALPGVTEEILTAAKAEAMAEYRRSYRQMYKAPAAAEPDPGAEFDPELHSVHFRLGRELGQISAIADDDATAEDLIALMPELKAKLLARKSKRDAERKRPDFLRLVVDNDVQP